MKNKERIEQLEKQVQVLLNRVALLELRATSKTVEVPNPRQIWNPNTVPYTPYITCSAKH